MQTNVKNFKTADGLPLPRALVGTNTNKPYEQASDQEDGLYKFNSDKMNNHALHMTMEFVDINTNLRFARTYFLSNLSEGYMHNTFFSDNDDFRVLSPQGKKCERNTKLLFEVYTALIRVFEEVQTLYINQEQVEAHLEDTAFTTLGQYL